MTIIQRSNYLSASNCDALVAALPTLQTAYGRGHRKSDAGGDKVSVYQHIRSQWYPDSLKTVWKDNMPSEVVSSYIISTFVKLPADTGIMYPTTLNPDTRDGNLILSDKARSIGCFLSIALKDGQHLKLNGTKYDTNKGDALLFNTSDTYETEIISTDAYWSVNMVPAWKQATYGG